MPEVVRLEREPGQSLEVFSMKREGEPLGSIAFPVRDHVNAATMTSMMMSDYRWLPPGRSLDHNIVQGSILTSQRNECIQRMRGEWLLFIDDDMVFPPDSIGKLVTAREENDLDIIGGLCFQRAEPFRPTMYMRENATSGAYNFLEDWVDGEIKEVDATGCAFMLIHSRVFEMIAGGPMPPYEERIKMGGPPPNFFRWEGSLGEDLRFCQDAKAAGARIWVHTDVPIDHITEHRVTRRDYLMQIAMRDDETQKMRQQLNDQMGLPTMTQQRAKELLGW